MWFQSFPALLLGVLLSVASVCAGTVAVAFVDVKFDDKAAVWSLLLDRRYDKVIAITSGINAHGQAAHELRSYLDRQNDMANVRFDSGKIQILEGSNVLRVNARHEAWWQGQPSMPLDTAERRTLRGALRGNRVRVFQIAPTDPEQVQMVINAADQGSIDSYMLLHGYNSRQVNMEWQAYFLRNLRSWLQDRSPGAEVYFTTSFDSYAAKDGGKQPIEAIQHMFPDRDLEQAMKDPFWSTQLLRAYPTYTGTRFDVTDTRMLDNLIYHARRYPNDPTGKYWREKIAAYVEKVLEQHPDPRRDDVPLSRLRHTLAHEFTGPSTLELADANHIAAFHRRLDGDTSMHWKPVAYPVGPHEAGQKVSFEDATNEELHGWLLQGADRDADLVHIKRLAGWFH
ncbi:uncharacterized protein UTRI_03878_B [Ustilago trichophora]|uniref:Uncharacterized protein n=1 Tax=Ustilago trichophora TaxID=86804 RepID=A0A5C3E290_9BASI|nr:uncharacterized protein UTRI_03878_B [Ustilago trichophora]